MTEYCPVFSDTSDELFHRNSDLTRLTLEPGLVFRIDIADGKGGAHRRASLPVGGSTCELERR